MSIENISKTIMKLQIRVIMIFGNELKIGCFSSFCAILLIGLNKSNRRRLYCVSYSYVYSIVMLYMQTYLYNYLKRNRHLLFFTVSAISVTKTKTIIIKLTLTINEALTKFMLITKTKTEQKLFFKE